MPDEIKQERIEGPTPGGGLYAIAFYLDNRDRAVEKRKAKRAEIVEYDERDVAIARTYAEL